MMTAMKSAEIRIDTIVVLLIDFGSGEFWEKDMSAIRSEMDR